MEIMIVCWSRMTVTDDAVCLLQ